MWILLNRASALSQLVPNMSNDIEDIKHQLIIIRGGRTLTCPPCPEPERRGGAGRAGRRASRPPLSAWPAPRVLCSPPGVYAGCPPPGSGSWGAPPPDTGRRCGRTPACGGGASVWRSDGNVVGTVGEWTVRWEVVVFHEPVPSLKKKINL